MYSLDANLGPSHGVSALTCKPVLPLTWRCGHEHWGDRHTTLSTEPGTGGHQGIAGGPNPFLAPSCHGCWFPLGSIEACSESPNPSRRSRLLNRVLLSLSVLSFPKDGSPPGRAQPADPCSEFLSPPRHVPISSLLLTWPLFSYPALGTCEIEPDNRKGNLVIHIEKKIMKMKSK